MASNCFFKVLGILDNYLEKTTRNKLALPLGTCQTSFGTSAPPKLL